MGDDVAAPHAVTRDVPDDTSVRSLLDGILSAGYLATVAGGRATWIATAGDATPLAVLAQQWAAPRLFPAGRTPLTTHAGPDGTLRLHFGYRAQLDPEAEYARLGGCR